MNLNKKEILEILKSSIIINRNINLNSVQIDSIKNIFISHAYETIEHLVEEYIDEMISFCSSYVDGIEDEVYDSQKYERMIEDYYEECNEYKLKLLDDLKDKVWGKIEELLNEKIKLYINTSKLFKDKEKYNDIDNEKIESMNLSDVISVDYDNLLDKLYRMTSYIMTDEIEYIINSY